MIYDGYDFSDLLVVERVERSLLPGLTVNTSNVPGKDGTSFRSVTVDALTINVDVRIIAPADGAANQKLRFELARREIAGHLLKRRPCELVVDDAPDLVYTASLTGSTDLERFVYTGGTTLEFSCVEPCGVGRTVKRSASPSQESDASDVDQAFVRANVGGNYPTAPIVTFNGSQSMYQASFDGAMFAVYCMAGQGELVVDCHRKKAYQGSYAATVDINCEWPSWEPGVHTVQSDDAFAVEWSERWV